MSSPTPTTNSPANRPSLWVRMFNIAGLGLLNRFINVSSTVALAVEEAKEVSTRSDVPNVVTGRSGEALLVPKDVRDIKPRFFRLDSGYTIAGKVLPEDRAEGSDSAATPLLIIAFPVLTALLVALIAITGFLGVTIAVLLGVPAYMLAFIALRQCEDTGTAVKAFALGTLLPVVGGPLAMMLNPMLANPMMLMNPLVLAVPMGAAVIGGAIALLFGGRLGAQKAVIWTGVIFAVIAGAAILPGFLGVIPFYALGCVQAYLFAHGNRMTRAIELERQFLRNEAELSITAITDSHREARLKQAINAAEDTTAFIPYGVARGVLTQKRDGYAPDPGLPLGQTLRDMSDHLIVLGPTGAGKTSGLLRPIIKGVADNLARARKLNLPLSQHVGMLLMDGKGSLPNENRDRVDVMIEPGVPFGLIEGLSATDLTAAIIEISVSERQRSGEGAFFVTSAEQMLRHFTVFHKAYVENLERLMVPLEGGEYQWSWTSLRKMFQRLVTVSDDGLSNGDMADMVLAELAEGRVAPGADPNWFTPEERRHPDIDKGGLLDAAVEYIRNFPKTSDQKTLNNIWSTLQSWIDPLTAHEDLVAWGHQTTGLDPTECLRGKIVGVNIPVFKYGTAARLIQALVKQRNTNLLKRRGDDPDWLKRGDQGPVIMMMDECQDLIGQTETDMAPVGRSLGARYVLSTQNVDGLFAKLGNNHAATQFLDSMRSFVAIGECSEATRHWMSQRLGVGSVYRVNSNPKAIDFDSTLTSMAGSPLNDPRHELAREMRMLKRAGAGILAHNGVDTKGRDGGWQGQKLKANMDRNDLVESVLSAGVYEDGPWLTPIELSRYLAEPNVAVAQVMRGGVKRRDIITLSPIFFEGKAKPTDEAVVGVDESRSVSNVEGVVTTDNRSDDNE